MATLALLRICRTGATQSKSPMKLLSIAVLLSVISPAAFALQPEIPLKPEFPGAPLDRSPIAAYTSVPAGPARTISGRCFVVTDGGQRIQMAQVVVRIYPQREFEWYAQEVGARCQARFDGLRALACPKDFAALSIPAMNKSIAAAEALQRDFHDVWQILPAADASARTDADGRFTITHHVAVPYIVFAVGSRTFGGETEFYQWQVSSNVISNPSEIELGNDYLR
jgi:hypothetical protein